MKFNAMRLELVPGLGFNPLCGKKEVKSRSVEQGYPLRIEFLQLGWGSVSHARKSHTFVEKA